MGNAPHFGGSRAGLFRYCHAARTVTGAAIRYGFTGREHDAETGLIRFRARAYDPGTGQFLQRDPIGFAAGDLNLYAYTWNDPFNWTDPSGLTSSTETYGLNAGSRGIGAGLMGRLVLAVRNLAQRIAFELAKAAISSMIGAGSGDDAGADAGDGNGVGAGGGSGSGGDGDGDDDNGYFGSNGKKSGNRINSDKVGGQEAADRLFDQLAEGEIRTEANGTRITENNVRILTGADGRPRVDIPASVSGNPLRDHPLQPLESGDPNATESHKLVVDMQGGEGSRKIR